MLNERGYATLVMVGIIAVAALGAAGTFAWTMRSAGYAKAEGEYKPQLEKANADLKLAVARVDERDRALTEANQKNATLLATINEMRAAFAEAKSELDKIKLQQSAQAAEVKKQLDQFLLREKRQTAEIARLRAIVASPVITEGVLDEADAILRTLIRDRTTGSVRP